MKKLKFSSGQGYGYSKDVGVFEVRATETKTFTNLAEAIEYYEILNEEKAIWDLTDLPELLEAHVFE